MKHPCEPTLDELLARRTELYSQEFTVEVEKKIKAIEAQIARIKQEEKT